MASIRMIGDPVLHRQARLFPDNPNAGERQELERQIGVAKSALIAAGGVGIAANQCADIASPYQLIIVGIFHDNPMHTAPVQERYPDTVFPEAMILINPHVQGSSGSTIFRHRCLSVPGMVCGEIETPAEITVDYLLPTGSAKTQTFKGMGAVVLQHELNHILDGKTYMDCCFEKLHPSDLKAVVETLTQEAKTPSPEAPEQPACLVDIDKAGASQLDRETLQKLDACVTADILDGIRQRAALDY